MTRSFKIFLIAAISLFMTIESYAQYVPTKERGNAAKRTKAQMEGNRVRATFFNHGQAGRTSGSFPINEQTPFEWPKNTGQVYLALLGLMAGAEVTDNTGTRQRIVEVPNYRSSPAGKSWNFEPVPGYFNETTNQIATSVDPDTWPAYWPDRMNDDVDPGWRGSWNGYFGKNIFNADQEIFYRATDDNYDRYANYYPDDTDLSRKGLGLLIDVRVLAWSQVLVEDAVYTLHSIRNDGTKDLQKVGVTIWYADFVGGDGDSQDDISEFDLLEDIAWTRDNDHRAPTFGSDPVGIVAVAFLETPGNALDRIDNDGDSPELNNLISTEMLEGETPDNLIDDNGNGLIDENQTHVPFGVQRGVTYADRIAQPADPNYLALHPRFKVEQNSPVVTQQMIDLANSNPGTNKWKLWPPLDQLQNGAIHLIMVTADKLNLPFKDGIDNDNDGEENSPVVSQAMITQAAGDAPFFRYRVNDKIILYNVVASALGKKYADGIDNDGNGAVDEGIDDGIDVLVDEARDDGIDNDYDWNPLRDDVGMDGVADTGDEGENDGKPTSGARLGLPGEPNVDVTDVSETDQIGITNADYVPAGGLNINSDAQMWFDFMIPGKFFDPQEVVAGEYDLFVSSSLFPLRSGQQEPISLVVLLANGTVPDPGGQFRKGEILRKRVRAQETYNNDYRFANAPLTPTLSAIPGDNRVTLYWDDVAERSFDAYIDAIGGNGRDFEGYKIYRASDPAFQDAEQITNGFGGRQFRLPIAQFDLVNGIKGFDPIGIDGIKYYLGDDTGLKHEFVDTTVQNGFTYYYAVVAYDFGFPAGDIIPSESTIRVSLQADGSVKLGSNVARVTPSAPVAGYVPPTLGNISLLQGTTSGRVNYKIVDINKIKNNHVYYITFEDTVKLASRTGVPDTLTTKSFSLRDSTAGVTLINKSRNLASDFEQPLTDGFRLGFLNESRVELDRTNSIWSDPKIVNYQFEKFVWQGGINGEERPNDYKIEFGDLGFGTSKQIQLGVNTFPARPVNFKVFNISQNKYIEFGFVEVDGTDGNFSVNGARRDRIVFLEPDQNGVLKYTWWFYLIETPSTANGLRLPRNGDKIEIRLKKPFLSGDVFRFVATSGKIDLEEAKKAMDKIKVVPNPYVASAQWEAKNPYASGRGPRLLQFNHLPSKCTIRIFTINGELVDVIEHESPLNDGTAEWNMLTKDNLNIAYGIYVFHVDAPGIGTRIGKFAVIK
ncbi:MAG TPA: hypothetical protein PLZ15_02280 [Melioribacteraceae bacterium]|nr:hypothetical protein [Melioribacteraceae bacterium]